MTDWGWVSRELAGARVQSENADAVVYVLELLEKSQVEGDDAVTVLRAATELVQGHSITPPEKSEKWVPVRPGEYRIGDTVRVRASAYEGDRGVKHNGQRGRAVAARDGFVLVVYDGQLDADIQYRHRPEHLQKLV